MAKDSLLSEDGDISGEELTMMTRMKAMELYR